MKKIQKILLFLGLAGFTALFLFSGWKLLDYYSAQKHSKEVFQQVAALVQEPQEGNRDTEPDPSGDAGENAADQPSSSAAYEKYAAVYAQNSHFVGWLSIPGTSIDYPVMQTPDSPNYYLRRGFDREYSYYGVPYLQENCDLGSSDNLVIYGHNMNNGTMFADLCEYEEPDFYRENPYIHFDTLSGFGTYQIIAVFKTVATVEEEFPYYHFVNASDASDFDSYVSECQTRALYDTGVSAQYGDRLITLSTCEYSRTDGRLVVVAKKISDTP